MNDIRVGDRVAVNDAGLVKLARVLGDGTRIANTGVVDHIDGNSNAIVYFDDGGAAPYHLDDCIVLVVA